MDQFLRIDAQYITAPHPAGEASPRQALWPVARVVRTSPAPDRVLVGLYEPMFRAIGRVGTSARRLSSPRVATSILYIVVTMLALIGLLFLPGVGS